MTLLITGSNGFVGSALCREGLRRGKKVVALVRQGSSVELLPPGVAVANGDFTKPHHCRFLMEKLQPQAVLHAAAVVSTGTPDLRESLRVNVAGTRTLAAAAMNAGVARWIQISSMSAHDANKSVYGGTKYAADRALEAMGAPATILRPSLVYGPQRRGIFWKLIEIVRRWPVVPLVGFGSDPVSPIHVDDLARAAFDALETPATVGRTYQLGGPEDWTFRILVEQVARKFGRRPLLVPMPLPVCRAMAALAEEILAAPPLTSDNIEGVANGHAVDRTAAARDLHFSPRSFEVGFATSLAEGLLG